MVGIIQCVLEVTPYDDVSQPETCCCCCDGNKSFGFIISVLYFDGLSDDINM
jgi:hypothetical protein